MQEFKICKAVDPIFIQTRPIMRATKFFLSRTMRVRNIVYILAMSAFLITFSAVVYASQITVGWDNNSEPDITGYKLHYGTSTRNYDYNVDVGNYTSCTISDLQEGTTYYFAATAYNSQLNESGFSEEIAYSVPITPQPSEPTMSDPAIYVSDIYIDLFKKGPNYQARAYVIVWDDIDRVVSEVVVSAQWFLNGKYIKEVSDLSDRKGSAKLTLNKVRAQPGDQLTLMVTDVVKYGYSYNSGSNIADETSVNLP